MEPFGSMASGGFLASAVAKPKPPKGLAEADVLLRLRLAVLITRRPISSLSAFLNWPCTSGSSSSSQLSAFSSLAACLFAMFLSIGKASQKIVSNPQVPTTVQLFLTQKPHMPASLSAFILRRQQNS